MTSERDIAIRVDRVSKIYRTFEKPWHRLAELVSGNRIAKGHDIVALQDISIDLQKGDRLGIVGENGSGKSTLLKIITGVLNPSTGSVSSQGRVSALLELGAGFNGELSGIENVEAFCMVHGLSREETAEALPRIVAFSELGDFVHYPVKTYSSGMGVRLGFACAVYVQPDVLIVDEALSVGDAYFQSKCLHKIKSMLDNGATFIYVTHTSDSVRALCNKGLWLDHGRAKLFGSSTAVGEQYESAMFAKIGQLEIERDHDHSGTMTIHQDGLTLAKRTEFAKRVEALRIGTGEIRISYIEVNDGRGAVAFDDQVSIKVYLNVLKTPKEPCAVSLGLSDSLGREIIHLSSAAKGIRFQEVTRFEQCLEFKFKNVLCPSEYSIMAGVGPLEAHPQTASLTVSKGVVDYCVGGSRFLVNTPSDDTDRDLWGVVHVPYEVGLTQ